MGNTEYRQHELLQYRPQMQNFTLMHCYSPLSIYRNLYSTEEMMEFKQRLYSTQDIDRKIQTFVARYQHIYLVSSLYMKLEGGNNCGNTEYQLSVYYQRVVTNLSKINEISFKDSLHCLLVALKGFEILYKNFGYFQIFENMFHISQRGKLKVWCNQHIYKNVPQQYLLGDGKEEDMVLKIINIIDMNTDQNCRVFPIRQHLSNLNKINFTNAIVALRQICRQNNFVISQRLQSLQNFSQFQSVLDIYTPPKRFPKDTQITFQPKSSKNVQFEQQRDPQATPMRSSSSSSHRTGNNIFHLEHGKSVQAPRSKSNNGFQLTIGQEEQFPRFVAGRKKTPSKSNSNSSRKISNSPNFRPNLTPAPNIRVSHPHLQQFSKLKPEESQLKKRTSLPQNQQQFSRYTYVPTQQTIPQQSQLSIIYGQRPVNNHIHPNPQIKPVVIQSAPVQLTFQRQVSAPNLILNQQQQFLQVPSQNNLQYPFVQKSNHNHLITQQTPRLIHNPIYSPRVKQHIPFNQRYINQNNQSVFRYIPQQNAIKIGQTRTNNFIGKHNIPNTNNNHQIRVLEKSRGLSVPINLSYQGTNSQELIISPKKNEQLQKKLRNQQTLTKQFKIDHSKERLVTLGQISGQKNPIDEVKLNKKDQKIQLMQLESKIQMLQSFADNKITTHQFLPNQSHALSNIKWQKNSNSGRDSVTSAFRKDILLELSGKPSQKKTFQQKKDQNLLRKDFQKYISKFEDNGYYTNQRLLELIKTGSNSKSYDFSKLSFEEKMKNYGQKYGEQDSIKQTTKSSEPTDFYSELYKRYGQKYSYASSNNLFGEQNSTPTFGHQNAPFKKKAEPYINKISAISQKWQEQNICSTSNGSRGRNIQSSNIDDDILEDMHNEGFGMLFKKAK